MEKLSDDRFDIGKMMQKIMADTYIRYNGTLIEKLGIGRFIVFDRVFYSLHDAQKAVDIHQANWNEKIKKQNP